MKRIAIQPRADWRERVESVGMLYHTIDDEIYWDESACYRFTGEEIDTLDVATAELQSLVEEVIRRNLFSRLCIPEPFVKRIIYAWEMDEPSIYGRFDFSWDGSGPPKLLEYNADTPTSLLEASVVQWYWLQDTHPQADQFNSIHEKLISFWQRWPYLQRDPVHFACASGSMEDLGNLEYRENHPLCRVQTHTPGKGRACRQLQRCHSGVCYPHGQRHFPQRVLPRHAGLVCHSPGCPDPGISGAAQLFFGPLPVHCR